MSAIEQQDSHRPPSDGGMAKEEFIRVGTTLYKIVEQPKLNGGYIRKRIAWNNETLRQDYGKDYIGRVPKYDGTSSGNSTSWGWTICNCSTCNQFRSCLSCCWCRKNATRAKAPS